MTGQEWLSASGQIDVTHEYADTDFMRISERQWATLGKILAAVGTIMAIIVGAIQIGRALSGPRLTASLSVEEDRISPKVRDALANRIDRAVLLRIVAEHEKKNESPAKILTALKERFNESPDRSAVIFEFVSPFESKILHFRILNQTDELAKDVRLTLPGAGKAEISETGGFSIEKPPVTWSRELVIGPVRPNSGVEVLVWPDGSTLMSLFGVNAALTYEGGFGKVREVRGFYGWDADTVAWFLAQAWFVRYGMLALTIFVVVVLARALVRRGHIVFKPRNRDGAQTQEHKDDLRSV